MVKKKSKSLYIFFAILIIALALYIIIGQPFYIYSASTKVGDADEGLCSVSKDEYDNIKFFCPINSIHDRVQESPGVSIWMDSDSYNRIDTIFFDELKTKRGYQSYYKQCEGDPIKYTTRRFKVDKGSEAANYLLDYNFVCKDYDVTTEYRCSGFCIEYIRKITSCNPDAKGCSGSDYDDCKTSPGPEHKTAYGWCDRGEWSDCECSVKSVKINQDKPCYICESELGFTRGMFSHYYESQDITLGYCEVNLSKDGVKEASLSSWIVCNIPLERGCDQPDDPNCYFLASVSFTIPSEDMDGDGILNADDDCPKDFGFVEFSGCPDTDGDGLSDKEEIEIGTDPTKADTDGDGVSDKEEIEAGTDPLKAPEKEPVIEEEEEAVPEEEIAIIPPGVPTIEIPWYEKIWQSIKNIFQSIFG